MVIELPPDFREFLKLLNVHNADYLTVDQPLRRLEFRLKLLNVHNVDYLTVDQPLRRLEFRLRLLNVHNVDYLLVGGFAVGFHGCPRQ